MIISEDDPIEFLRWVRAQGVDPLPLSLEDLEVWRRAFRGELRDLRSPRVRPMKLKLVPDEFRYAVAVREGSNVWLTMWVRRSSKGEFSIITPIGDKEWKIEWHPQTTYHLDGMLRTRDHKHNVIIKNCQPLTGTFRGTESLGVYYGPGPKNDGAIFDPTVFTAVVEVSSSVFGSGVGIGVEIMAPDNEAVEASWSRIITRQIFRETVPWVVITVRTPLNAEED